MRKYAELEEPTSCLNKAREAEMIFVLLGRDPAAPFAIRAWCGERVRSGKNSPDDDQIKQAIACAAAMEDDAHE